MLTALDQIANQNHLQIFKAVIPFIPRQEQRFFSVYIKMLEFQNISRFFNRQSLTMQACSVQNGTPDLSGMLKEIRNYCDDNEAKKLDQINTILTTMELFSVMSETDVQEDPL